MPCSDPNVIAVADRVIATYRAEQGSDRCDELVSIVSATRQVVAGMRYKLTLDIAPRPCACADSCVANASNVQRVTASVWVRPWLHEAADRYTVTIKSD